MLYKIWGSYYRSAYKNVFRPCEIIAAAWITVDSGLILFIALNFIYISLYQIKRWQILSNKK